MSDEDDDLASDTTIGELSSKKLKLGKPKGGSRKPLMGEKNQ